VNKIVYRQIPQNIWKFLSCWTIGVRAQLYEVNLVMLDKASTMDSKNCKCRKSTLCFGSKSSPENCEVAVNFCEEILNQYFTINFHLCFQNFVDWCNLRRYTQECLNCLVRVSDRSFAIITNNSPTLPEQIHILAGNI
jgi:hypothetical protein